MSCFVIAEAGVNHNGAIETALRLVESAALAGADAVKFQTFRAAELAAPGAATAAYQQTRTGAGKQLAMLRELELSPAAHKRLAKRCGELGIEFMSTPFDTQAADLLCALGVKRLKIPSGELTNLPLIDHLAATGLPLVVSTGMATLAEVRTAVGTIAAARARCGFEAPLAETLVLLHCTSSYPAPVDQINLRAMTTMHRELGLPVGYSDHTEGTLIPAVAVALGATVIEKHFTLDRRLSGPDHAFSLEPDELGQMITQIRTIERALGDGVKAPCSAELAVRDAARRSIVLRRAVQAGAMLCATDLTLQRPGTGLPPCKLAGIIGRRVKLALPVGHVLHWHDLA